mmetsp:Transcript_221/g.350  ORF Transcript_221/g.350 Transcript_221/m.350 type:complete len:250 (-) Transcript_221:61-810(-)
MTVNALTIAVGMLLYCYSNMVRGADWPNCEGQVAVDLRPCWSKCLGGLWHGAHCTGDRSAGAARDDLKSERECCKTSMTGCKTKQKLCIYAGWDQWYLKGNEAGGSAGCSNNACDGAAVPWAKGKYCVTEGKPPHQCPEGLATMAHENVFCPWGNAPGSEYEYKNICKATTKFTHKGGVGSGKYEAATAHRSRFGDLYEFQEQDQQEVDARFDEFEQELEKEIEIDRLKLRLDRARLTQNRLRHQRQHH